MARKAIAFEGQFVLHAFAPSAPWEYGFFQAPLDQASVKKRKVAVDAMEQKTEIPNKNQED